MRKIIKLLVIFFLVIVTSSFLYFIVPLVADSIWNYGFGYNISKGMIPYKDFNMIVPPLFPFIVSIFIRLFGNKFIVYIILISFFTVLITYYMYKRIGFKALIIYFLLLLYPYNGYNMFSLLLVFILIGIVEKDSGNDLLIAIVISLMIFTKQTLGIFIIPSIIYSKNRKKTICVYLISFFAFIIYLVLNDNLYQFIDYCFLGMFDFTAKNNTGFNLLLFLEVFICIFMIYRFIMSKCKDVIILYILLFQIVSFPIVDNSHFIITSCPFIYYVFKNYHNKLFLYAFSVCYISFIIGYGVYIFKSYDYVIYKKENSFINYKRVSLDYLLYFDTIDRFRNKYSDYRLYLFDTRAYTGKLEYDIDIDKYDLINDGNMGYNGCYKYLESIKKYCKVNKCLFIVNVKEATKNINQSNKYIIKYIMSNYYNISSSGLENVYINKM